MKFTYSWLLEHLETNATPAEIADKLTAIGLEVDAFTDMGKKYAPFIVAEIKAAEKHPNADKLRVCTVNNGKEDLQIVCGAPNARAGIKVVLAPIGAMIPNGNFQIKKSKIRDVESNGMLCSADELELSGDAEGIIELPTDAPVGKAYAEYANMNDSLFEINITPNRADCLGVHGIARDLAAAGMGKLKPLQNAKGEPHVALSPIKVTSPSYYIGSYIKGVSNGKNDFSGGKLKAIGSTPISTLVDITNYITFDLGRPLHVYDADRIKGNITIRHAKKGEKINALNNKTYELDGELIVADDSGPIALAGVIGNVETSVDDRTKNVFLEVAYFDPAEVAKTGRKHQIDSDARYRFERGVDPDFLEGGANVAISLITKLCGGVASAFVGNNEKPKFAREIEFDFNKIKIFGGIEIQKSEAEKILTSLGFKIKKAQILNSFQDPSKGPETSSGHAVIGVPSWRGDVEGSADIIEEILRIYGYDKVPSQALPPKSGEKFVPTQFAMINYTARHVLANRGHVQCVTYAFMKPELANKFGGGKKELQLQNPISVELSEMRPSIIPNLLEAAAKNSNRGFKNLSLFESGPVFGEKEQMMISGLRVGKNAERNIYGDSRNIDVFDVKADLLAVLKAIDAPQGQVQTEAPSYYHPGKSGGLYLGKTCLGYFGELHPKILKAFDLNGPVAAFEIFTANIPVSKKKYKQLEVSDFQTVARDFAFLLNKEVSADDLLAAVKKADPLIDSAEVFDVYDGNKITAGKKSIALSININPKDKTLTDKEIETISAKVIDNITKKFAAELRA